MTSCSDFYQFGAGHKGIFISYRQDTGLFEGLALLSRAGMNKNTFFLSAFVWAVEVFEAQVAPDFGLQDGICIVAAVTLTPNLEMIINALISGKLAKVWGRRNGHVAGALGLVLAIARDRNGGTNYGKGYARRCQPWVNTETVDMQRYIDLIGLAVKACNRSKTKPLPGTPESYKHIVGEMNSAVKGGDTMLSIQHFVHLLCMLRYLLCDSALTQFAIVSTSNSNKERLVSLFGVASQDDGQMVIFQKQGQLFFSTVFEEMFSQATYENSVCELSRDAKTKETGKGKKVPSGFPAMDLVFPGQGFLQTIGQPGGKTVYQWAQPRWDKSCGRFHASPTPGFVVPWEGKARQKEDLSMLAGKLLVKNPGGAGSCKQICLERERIPPPVFETVKKLMSSSPRKMESYPDYHERVCGEVQDLLRPILNKARNKELVGWDSSNPLERWNQERHPKVVAALKNLNVQIRKERQAPVLHPRERRNPPPRKQRVPDPPRKAKPCPRKSLLAADSVAMNLDSLLNEPLPNDEAPLDETPKRPPQQQGLPCGPVPKRVRFGSEKALPAQNNANLSDMLRCLEDLRGEEDDEEDDDSDQLSFSTNGSLVVGEMDEEGEDCVPTEPGIAFLFGATDGVEAETAAIPAEVEDTTAIPPPGHNGARGRHPLIRDSSTGLDRKLDWSDHNLARIAVLDREGPNRRMSFPKSAESIVGDNFHSFQGSDPLLSKVGGTTHKIPSLFDEARNAVNSGRALEGKPPLAFNLKAQNFGYPQMYHPETQQPWHSCTCSVLTEYGNVFVPQRCHLCDSIAQRLRGEALEREGEVCWWFDSPQQARTFLLLCVVFTSGDSQHYTNLHARAKKKFMANLETAKEFDEGSSAKGTRNRFDELAKSDYFVVAFGNAQATDTDVPYFYLIGNLKNNRSSHRRTSEMNHHDFCFAIPDHGHYRQLYHGSDTRKRAGRRTNPGKATCIRALQPLAEAADSLTII
jgi:hypothetical protein